ncbi:Homogentisate 1,2-dioxygenase [Trichodelitschia bisporula]|uniref:homogentisate 1,2-dioxygenase n=1 Tax=Trichodelitschia bisporula TaxID=703511 RepID=A0A6G1HZE8_9PEZI|nr:Homogentisate 1,2-dioxygenase [Trichodelitschia bisporula]
MPSAPLQPSESYQYLNGFNCYHESEAMPDTLPLGRNSPQRPAHGLYTEKLSGTSFTAPRSENQQTWLYRILPSVKHESFEPYLPSEDVHHIENCHMLYRPNQLRWGPTAIGESDWLHSLVPVAGAGDPKLKSGLYIYMYSASKSMPETDAFYSADGDFLIVPQEGALDLTTELGNLLVRPGEIVVVPRGIRFRVAALDELIRGYALELFQGHFQLPELGPIGSNGLANARDFQAPVARFDEDHDGSTTYQVFAKFAGELYFAEQDHTPFDVVAWHGNYYPYKYDLSRFCTINTVSYDHIDPSIFTVLTAPSDHPGTAIADFVVFPPRWAVAENTFRPPWFHRNCMSEFMGLIRGRYDARKGGANGFMPGCASLHNVMAPHGPDVETEQAASWTLDQPEKVGEGGLAFMFESCLMLGSTYNADIGRLRKEYVKESWGGFPVRFKRPRQMQTHPREA